GTLRTPLQDDYLPASSRPMARNNRRSDLCRRHLGPSRSQCPPHRTRRRKHAPDTRQTEPEGLTTTIAGDTNPSASEARDPGGIIPFRWATSFRNPGRHHPVIPGRLGRNPHTFRTWRDVRLESVMRSKAEDERHHDMDRAGDLWRCADRRCSVLGLIMTMYSSSVRLKLGVCTYVKIHHK